MSKNHEGALDHQLDSIEELLELLPAGQYTHVLAKQLPKNANDKNQVRWSSDFSSLGSMFEFEFRERACSESLKKGGAVKGKAIPEGVFKNFEWLCPEGAKVRAENVKMLIYAQYPEMRLSGFKTVSGKIPESLSATYVKNNPGVCRILVLARTRDAGAVAMMVLPSEQLVNQLKAAEGYQGSKVVKLLRENTGHEDEVREHMATFIETWLPGVRLDKKKGSVPFNGKQVCGYTLEDQFDLPSNSDKNGDIHGIELKAHTRPKVTLMTTEPDLGEYAEDFDQFMVTRGYQKGAAYRWTGVHKAGVPSARSGLTLRVKGYDPTIPFSRQLTDEMYVGLFSDDGKLTAGWSMERLLGGWGAKHNEAVYVAATRRPCEDDQLAAQGHNFEVYFDREVIWCKGTSPKHLLDAILRQDIVIDPAPKLVPGDRGENKRRTQWRVNSVRKVLPELYEVVEVVNVVTNERRSLKTD
ncbi:hypothetical protein KUW04_13190 [Halomonas denitrificans]|nr:hypothetical protein [Halomonas denitrificans]